MNKPHKLSNISTSIFQTPSRIYKGLDMDSSVVLNRRTPGKFRKAGPRKIKNTTT